MTRLIMENVARGKKFWLKNNPTLSYTRSNPVIQITVPEQDEPGTNVVKVEGVEGKVNVVCTLMTEQAGTDLSLGTNTPAITTIWQQLNYLSNFVTASISETHRLTLDDGGSPPQTLFQRTGVFSKIVFRMEAGRGELATLEVDFDVGEVI